MDITSGEKKVILVLGKRGSGKSYHVKQYLAACDRFVVYDVLGEYQDGLIFQTFNEIFEFWKRHLDTGFRLIYQPLNPQTEFDQICRLVWACGDLTFVVEEVDTFCGSFTISDDFAQIIQRGRHRNITLIGVSQRPYGVNRLLSSQAKEIISFQQSEPRDIDYLSLYFGSDVEKVRTLPLYTYLHWDNGTITTRRDGKIQLDKAPIP